MGPKECSKGVHEVHRSCFYTVAILISNSSYTGGQNSCGATVLRDAKRGLPGVRDARRGLPVVRDARRGLPVVRDARRGFPDVRDARCGLPAPQLISHLVILLRQFDGRRFGRRGCGGGFHRSTTARKRARRAEKSLLSRSSATSENEAKRLLLKKG